MKGDKRSEEHQEVNIARQIPIPRTTPLVTPKFTYGSRHARRGLAEILFCPCPTRSQSQRLGVYLEACDSSPHL